MLGMAAFKEHCSIGLEGWVNNGQTRRERWRDGPFREGH